MIKVLLLVFLIGAPLFAKEKQGALVNEALAKAKQFMAQGQRRQAVLELTRASESTKSRKKLREIEGRKALFSEQFFTSGAFQQYQEAKALAELKRWDECLRELAAVPVSDQDNMLILKLKAESQLGLKQYDAAEKTISSILVLLPDENSAQFGRVRILHEQSLFSEAMIVLQKIQARNSEETERFAIAKARILDAQKKTAEAVEVLRDDQVANLDHIEVLYELGMLHRKLPGQAWQARKTLSLFVTRCKRMNDAELKKRGFDLLLPQAQTALIEIDKQLGV